MTSPMPGRPAQVVVADDHPVVSLAVADSLNEEPGLQVVATVKSGTELLSVLQTEPCQLIVTDFTMQSDSGDGDGLRLISRLQRTYPNIPIVVFTMMTNSGILAELRQLGVAGIVSKEDPIRDLIQVCLNALLGSAPMLSASVSKRLSHRDVTMGDAEKQARDLSPKELEVLRMFAQGLSLTEIARRLNRSVTTIGSHKQSAMRKLNIETNADLFKYSGEHGLL